ncbi:30S ribosomal protein S5 [bacterium]|nr:30S ribosomal protein S5 [bacterium]
MGNGPASWAGLGKAREVPEAVAKGREQAIKNMQTINLKGTTIPHEVLGVYGAGRVLMRPASRGTGIKAGGAVRALAEAVGVRDILTKSLGSNNPISMVRAALAGFSQLSDIQEVRALRGVAGPEEKDKDKGEKA